MRAIGGQAWTFTKGVGLVICLAIILALSTSLQSAKADDASQSSLNSTEQAIRQERDQLQRSINEAQRKSKERRDADTWINRK
jgi:hypothetical protein